MKKRNLLHATRFLAACLMLCALLTPCAAAITPSYTVSSAYRKSTYYQNLLQLPHTGSGAFDTLSAALSQYGYHEGNGSADYGGGGSGNGNYTEYNYALGKVGGSYSYAWCAAFVSWCLVQAGEGESAGGLFASCTLWVEALRERGQYTARAAHTPKMGDLIFFRSAGVTRASDHVGLVRFVKGGRVYTVEGNSSGQVALRNYALTDSYIVGYGRPAYEKTASAISRTKHEDVTAGYYVVTYDFLNVRGAANASSTKKGQLDEGELIRVSAVKNGWGRIEYQGKEAYVSLEYADFVAPASHTVTYVSEGKTLLKRDFFTTDAATVAPFTPEREGYSFVAWQDEAGRTFADAERLPAADLLLTAVWEKLPATEAPSAPEENIPPNGIENEGEHTENEGGADAPLLPEEGLLPVLPPPLVEVPPRDYTLAARVAGGIVALFSVALFAVWYKLRKKT
ncbi:MAG: CHAP domain-containing protein [Ruminococcaceae bacterium]|nr:CHAP domain-containing protein [Oscillospiraceae bacterium]